MTITFDAVDAAQGDSLIIQFRHKDQDVLWVIDGGPSGTYARSLSKRLDAIRDDRDLSDEDPLSIDLLVVSHIDSDHIVGVNDLVDTVVDATKVEGTPIPYKVARAWHNSFDLVEEDDEASGAIASYTAALAEASAVAATAEDHRALELSPRQGDTLRRMLRFLKLGGNKALRPADPRTGEAGRDQRCEGDRRRPQPRPAREAGEGVGEEHQEEDRPRGLR